MNRLKKDIGNYIVNRKERKKVKILRAHGECLGNIGPKKDVVSCEKSGRAANEL